MSDYQPVIDLLSRLLQATHTYHDGTTVSHMLRIDGTLPDTSGKIAEGRLVLRRLEQASLVEVGPGGWRVTAGGAVWLYMNQKLINPDNREDALFRLGDTMLRETVFDRWSYNDIFQGIEKLHVRGLILRRHNSDLSLTTLNPLT